LTLWCERCTFSAGLRVDHSAVRESGAFAGPKFNGDLKGAHLKVDATKSDAEPKHFVGEEGVMVKYIAVGSYWVGVVCALVAVVGRLCDALGIAFVRIMTKGNMIDVRSFLDAGLLFLFIAMASVSYEWLQSRQRGS
jgi:hypothetical protein